MATHPLAESGGTQVDGWPTSIVANVTSYMPLPLLMQLWESTWGN